MQKFQGSGGGAASGENIVDERDPLASCDRVHMNLHDGASIFELILCSACRPRELPFFPYGNEADAELEGHGTSEDETACVDADDFCHAFASKRVGKKVDDLTEQFTVSKNGRDVFENDAGLWKVGHIPDS